jgi:uncharacterized membrane protein
MHPSSYHFLPLAPLFFLGLILLFVVAITLIELGVLQYAYEKMGISRRAVFSILLFSLLASYVNIPIAELPPEPIVSGEEVEWFGMHYVVPVVRDWQSTVLAVNLGGAVIPTVVAVYLLLKNGVFVQGLVAVILVAIPVHAMAHPVHGVGIVVPVILPPVIAALVAVLLSREKAAPLAYIAGTLGTLIGADVMNLGHLAGMGAPVASIGGAGTFDGVFLSGILAVLLA